MEVRAVYALIGEDFDLAVSRMVKEERIAKYLALFVKDTSFNDLEKSFENDDMETAFRAAHTLKGVCANLGMDKLGGMASILTEDLRNGKDIIHAREYFPEFKEEFVKVIRIIEDAL